MKTDFELYNDVDIILQQWSYTEEKLSAMSKLVLLSNKLIYIFAKPSIIAMALLELSSERKYIDLRITYKTVFKEIAPSEVSIRKYRKRIRNVIL